MEKADTTMSEKSAPSETTHLTNTDLDVCASEQLCQTNDPTRSLVEPNHNMKQLKSFVNFFKMTKRFELKIEQIKRQSKHKTCLSMSSLNEIQTVIEDDNFENKVNRRTLRKCVSETNIHDVTLDLVTIRNDLLQDNASRKLTRTELNANTFFNVSELNLECDEEVTADDSQSEDPFGIDETDGFFDKNEDVKPFYWNTEDDHEYVMRKSNVTEPIKGSIKLRSITELMDTKRMGNVMATKLNKKKSPVKTRKGRPKKEKALKLNSFKNFTLVPNTNLVASQTTVENCEVSYSIDRNEKTVENPLTGCTLDRNDHSFTSNESYLSVQNNDSANLCKNPKSSESFALKNIVQSNFFPKTAGVAEHGQRCENVVSKGYVLKILPSRKKCFVNLKSNDDAVKRNVSCFDSGQADGATKIVKKMKEVSLSNGVSSPCKELEVLGPPSTVSPKKYKSLFLAMNDNTNQKKTITQVPSLETSSQSISPKKHLQTINSPPSSVSTVYLRPGGSKSFTIISNHGNTLSKSKSLLYPVPTLNVMNDSDLLNEFRVQSTDSSRSDKREGSTLTNPRSVMIGNVKLLKPSPNTKSTLQQSSDLNQKVKLLKNSPNSNSTAQSSISLNKVQTPGLGGNIILFKPSPIVHSIPSPMTIVNRETTKGLTGTSIQIHPNTEGTQESRVGFKCKQTINLKRNRPFVKIHSNTGLAQHSSDNANRQQSSGLGGVETSPMTIQNLKQSRLINLSRKPLTSTRQQFVLKDKQTSLTYSQTTNKFSPGEREAISSQPVHTQFPFYNEQNRIQVKPNTCRFNTFQSEPKLRVVEKWPSETLASGKKLSTCSDDKRKLVFPSDIIVKKTDYMLKQLGETVYIPQKRKYRCSSCAIGFVRKFLHRQHMYRVTCNIVYQCAFCDNRRILFRNRCQFHNHMRGHSRVTINFNRLKIFKLQSKNISMNNTNIWNASSESDEDPPIKEATLDTNVKLNNHNNKNANVLSTNRRIGVSAPATSNSCEKKSMPNTSEKQTNVITNKSDLNEKVNALDKNTTNNNGFLNEVLKETGKRVTLKSKKKNSSNAQIDQRSKSATEKCVLVNSPEDCAQVQSQQCQNVNNNFEKPLVSTENDNALYQKPKISLLTNITFKKSELNSSQNKSVNNSNESSTNLLKGDDELILKRSTSSISYTNVKMRKKRKKEKTETHKFDENEEESLVANKIPNVSIYEENKGENLDINDSQCSNNRKNVNTREVISQDGNRERILNKNEARSPNKKRSIEINETGSFEDEQVQNLDTDEVRSPNENNLNETKISDQNKVRTSSIKTSESLVVNNIQNRRGTDEEEYLDTNIQELDTKKTEQDLDICEIKNVQAPDSNKTENTNKTEKASYIHETENSDEYNVQNVGTNEGKSYVKNDIQSFDINETDGNEIQNLDTINGGSSGNKDDIQNSDTNEKGKIQNLDRIEVNIPDKNDIQISNKTEANEDKIKFFDSNEGKSYDRNGLHKTDSNETHKVDSNGTEILHKSKIQNLDSNNDVESLDDNNDEILSINLNEGRSYDRNDTQNPDVNKTDYNGIHKVDSNRTEILDKSKIQNVDSNDANSLTKNNDKIQKADSNKGKSCDDNARHNFDLNQTNRNEIENAVSDDVGSLDDNDPQILKTIFAEEEIQCPGICEKEKEMDTHPSVSSDKIDEIMLKLIKRDPQKPKQSLFSSASANILEDGVGTLIEKIKAKIKDNREEPILNDFESRPCVLKNQSLVELMKSKSSNEMNLKENQRIFFSEDDLLKMKLVTTVEMLERKIKDLEERVNLTTAQSELRTNIFQDEVVKNDVNKSATNKLNPSVKTLETKFVDLDKSSMNLSHLKDEINVNKASTDEIKIETINLIEDSNDDNILEIPKESSKNSNEEKTQESFGLKLENIIKEKIINCSASNLMRIRIKNQCNRWKIFETLNGERNSDKKILKKLPGNEASDENKSRTEQTDSHLILDEMSNFDEQHESKTNEERQKFVKSEMENLKKHNSKNKLKRKSVDETKRSNVLKRKRHNFQTNTFFHNVNENSNGKNKKNRKVRMKNKFDTQKDDDLQLEKTVNQTMDSIQTKEKGSKIQVKLHTTRDSRKQKDSRKTENSTIESKKLLKHGVTSHENFKQVKNIQVKNKINEKNIELESVHADISPNAIEPSEATKKSHSASIVERNQTRDCSYSSLRAFKSANSSTNLIDETKKWCIVCSKHKPVNKFCFNSNNVPDLKYMCRTYCQSIMSNRCTMRSHENLHEKRAPFICPVCAAVRGSYESLTLHMKRNMCAQKVAVAKCKFCRHIVSHDTLNIDLDKISLKLEKHYERSHCSTSNDAVGDKSFSCELCSAYFQNESRRDHFRLHYIESPFVYRYRCSCSKLLISKKSYHLCSKGKSRQLRN